MEQLEAQIKNLHTKLQQLLKQQQLLQRKNNTLEKQNAALKISLDEKNTIINAIQQRMDVFKLSANALSENEKQELKKRIDIYLAEIEKCLTLINE